MLDLPVYDPTNFLPSVRLAESSNQDLQSKPLCRDLFYQLTCGTRLKFASCDLLVLGLSKSLRSIQSALYKELGQVRINRVCPVLSRSQGLFASDSRGGRDISLQSYRVKQAAANFRCFSNHFAQVTVKYGMG